jgi:hypothetical protein
VRAHIYISVLLYSLHTESLAADSRCELSAPILERREIYAHTLSGSLLHTRAAADLLSVCGRLVVLGRAGALGPVVINSMEM